MTPAELVANAEAVILDFDGPMCSAFSSITAAEAADRLRRFLQGHSPTAASLELPAGDDPLDVLRAAVASSVELGWLAAHHLTLIELEAVLDASPTDGLEVLLHELRDKGLPVAVASNNSSAAIEWWLDRQGFRNLVGKVIGRRQDGDLLKPHPFILQEACRALNVRPGNALFIGDSVSDFEVAETLEVPFIGLAKSAKKITTFVAAGNDEIVTSLNELKN